MDEAHKGRFALRTAAVLMGLSVALEVLGIDAAVPLFGAVARGAPAMAYHLIYAVLFAVLGAGLWTGRRYGYYAVFLATVLYSIDRVQLVIWRDTLAALVAEQLAGSEELVAALGMDYLVQVLSLMSLVMMIAWWGFAGYVYWRRAYFGIGAVRSG